jgi:MoaA/NifB/PqqE/SkfB family radical SAM enzyme
MAGPILIPLKTVMLMITTRCSNGCAFCLNRRNIPQKRPELNTQEWLSVFQDLRKHTTAQNLFFIEREVFDRPDAVDLIIGAGQLGFSIFVSTGGSDELNENTARRIAPYLKHLIVSFHGLPEVIGSKTRKRQEILLDLMRDIFLPAGVSATISTTVTRKHSGHVISIIEEIARRLDREKIYLRDADGIIITYRTPHLKPEEHEPLVLQNFVQPCFQGGMVLEREALGWDAETDLSLFSDQEIDLIRRHRCSRNPERILFYSSTINGRPCGLEVNGSQGAVGYNRMTIRWDGEVVPCASSYQLSYGNILEHSAEKLWMNGYQSFRQPKRVNAYAIWRAFGQKGKCCYGQDAAYVADQSEENIITACEIYTGLM